MKPIRTFIATPALPAPIERLRELACNLHWAWDHDAIELFRRLDTDLWETSGHNPVLMLGTIEQAKLEAAAADEGFLAHLERVARDLDVYQASEATWFHRTYGVATSALVAYFSAEFGITECLSIFAGGLGCWPATISNRPVTWACRWSALGCFISRAICNSTLTMPVGNKKPTRTTTFKVCRSPLSAARMVRP